MKSCIVFLSTLLICLCSTANGQDARSFWALYGNVVLPQGDFGNDSGSDAGLATTGYGGGLEVSIPSGSPNLYYLISAHLLFNGLDDTELKSLMRQLFPGFSINIDAGNWMNIPVMAG